MTAQKLKDDWQKWHTPETVWLLITSWRGVSLGAIHYYGRLSVADTRLADSVDLKRTLTAAEARELTKTQNNNSLVNAKFRWHKGDETKCFDTEQEIIDHAIDVYKQFFPKAKRLVLGDNVYCKPGKHLHGEKI